MRVLFALMILGVMSCGTDAGQDNLPPTLELDIPAEVTYELGDVIRVTMSGSDPEGGAVTFSVENVPERATLQASSSFAVMTWDPLASDITPEGQPLQVIFVATDGPGARTERLVRMNIRSGSGAPRFTSSNSVLHNVGTGPVVFDITVRDDDSSGVSIAMPSGFAPEGAELTMTGPFSARFGWTPTNAQLERRVHTAKFIANDGDNDPVEQVVSIILKKESQANAEPRELDDSCRFESAVEYEGLLAQTGAQPYEIIARITPAGREAGYDRLVLNWTTEDVWNDWRLPWESSEMTSNGETWVGRIGNPFLTEGSLEIYYEICAINDDAEEGDNLAFLCGPTSLYDSFIAYPPGSGECINDFEFNDEFDYASSLQEDWLLGRLCADETDYYEVSLGTGQESNVYLVHPLHAQPKIEIYDANQNKLADPVAGACGGFTDIYLSNPGAPTKFFIAVKSNSNAVNIPYQILAETRDMTNAADCLDAQYEPNDTAAQATPITTASAMFTGLEICRADDVDVFSFEAGINQRIQITLNFVHDIGDVDVRLFRPSQSGNVTRYGSAAAWSVGVSDTETIDYVTTESGMHYILVYANRPNRYSMSFSQEAAGEMCVDDDPFAGNHTQPNARFLADGLHTGLKICPGKVDWFKFPVVDWTSESFDVIVDVSEGSLQSFTVQIWDIFGVVATATVSAGKLRAALNPFMNGDHYIRVASTASGTYSIDLQVTFQI